MFRKKWIVTWDVGWHEGAPERPLFTKYFWTQRGASRFKTTHNAGELDTWAESGGDYRIQYGQVSRRDHS